jgi:hypothetical protein
MENDQLYIFRISVDVRNFRALRRLPLPVASIFVKVTFPAEVVQLAVESTSKQAGKQLFFDLGQTSFMVPLSWFLFPNRKQKVDNVQSNIKEEVASVAPPTVISPLAELQVFCLNPYAGTQCFMSMKFRDDA